MATVIVVAVDGESSNVEMELLPNCIARFSSKSV
jgi:hypothetical protein